VLESTKNMTHAWDRKFIQVSVCQNCYYRHRTWFGRVIEKIKRVQFFASKSIYV